VLDKIVGLSLGIEVSLFTLLNWLPERDKGTFEKATICKFEMRLSL
jgi:hypothetical protein